MNQPSFFARQIATFICVILGSIPLPLRRALGRCLAGAASGLFLTRETQVINLQVKRFLPQAFSKIFSRQVFRHFGQIFFENLNTKPIINNARFNISSKTNVTIEEIQQLSHGALALTAHFGNWDVLGGYFSSLGVPLFTIGRRARNSIAQALLERIRNDNGITTLWRDDEQSAKEILRLFKSGKLVAALIDQDTPVRSVFIDFFGAPVKTPSGIVSLANKFQRPVYTAFLAQEATDIYTIYIERLPAQMSEEEVLAFYHRQLEAVIKQYPSQWVWFHKRWRTSEQKTLGTTEYLKWLKSQIQSAAACVMCVMCATWISGCNLFASPLSAAKQAQQQAEAGNTDKAIELYHQHISDRLADDSREEWENPYFYHLLIGDLELTRGRYTEALAAYQEARSHGVDTSLFLDRIRSTARKLEENNQLEQAMELLNQHVEDDPTLINESLDRISKKLLKK